MNGWRDMKTSPPAHGEAVIATDGAGGMWAGRVERVDTLPDLDKVVGANLHTGKPVQIYFDELTGWIPVSEKIDTAKSGDEMLRELGYTRHEGPACHLFGAHSSLFYYEKNSGSIPISITFNTEGYDEPCIKAYVDGLESHLMASEILACAQLVQEYVEAKK